MEDEELDYIDLETSEIIENEDGSSEIEFSYGVDSPTNYSTDHYANIAEEFNQEDLDEIGTMVVDSYMADRDSRSEWEAMTLDTLDNLGLVYTEGSEPFEGACTATHPLILESVVKFQSKISNELLPSKGPVKTKILGRVTDEREMQAKRVRDYMNYQVQNVISEFYSESEKTFFFVPLLGNAFKRNYYDPTKGRICNELIIDKLFVNNTAKSLQTAERISYVYYLNKRKMLELIDQEYFVFYDESDLSTPAIPMCSEFEDKIREIQGISSESMMFDEVYTLVEQHCYLQINEKTMEYDTDELARPYVVTVDVESGKVLSIRRNWRESDSYMQRLEWFTHYQFVPTAGFYALGYAHLLGNLQHTLTLAMRSLADAGQFANLSAGFKSKSARIAGDQEPIAPGEFRDVEIPAITKLSECFYPLPFKEPSLVLFQLMQELTAVGQKFADSTEQVIADSTNYGPVGTTMALLEASTRFYAAVYKRQYLAQAHEFKVISRLISDYSDNEYPYLIDEEQEFSINDDFNPDTIDIIPVSDPNYSSQAQRIAKAQAVFEVARQSPQHHDMKMVLREVHKAFEIENVDDILPKEDKPQMMSPIEDLLAVVQGKPIAAFKGQDHKSHVVIKQAWLADPNHGQTEEMAPFAAQVMSNIREHKMMQLSEELSAIQSQEKISLEEAMVRLSRLNQIAKEEEQKGSPATMIAQAELIKAETQRTKEERTSQQDQFKLGLEVLQTVAELERERSRAQEAGRQIDMESVRMGLDLMKTGIQEANKLDIAKIQSEKKPNEPKKSRAV